MNVKIDYTKGSCETNASLVAFKSIAGVNHPDVDGLADVCVVKVEAFNDTEDAECLSAELLPVDINAIELEECIKTRSKDALEHILQSLEIKQALVRVSIE